MKVRISDSLAVEDVGIGCVHISDRNADLSAMLLRQDAWKLALVLLRYAVTGRV